VNPGACGVESAFMRNAEFTVYIDGDCPLCRREASLLRWMDRGRGRLELVDIADPSFDVASDSSAAGVSMEELMGSIHGRTADGRMVTGVEVFRRAYRAVGFGWLLAWTEWPVIRPVVDRAYLWFAKHRLRLTGRCASGACRPAAQR